MTGRSSLSHSAATSTPSTSTVGESHTLTCSSVASVMSSSAPSVMTAEVVPSPVDCRESRQRRQRRAQRHAASISTATNAVAQLHTQHSSYARALVLCATVPAAVHPSLSVPARRRCCAVARTVPPLQAVRNCNCGGDGTAAAGTTRTPAANLGMRAVAVRHHPIELGHGVVGVVAVVLRRRPQLAAAASAPERAPHLPCASASSAVVECRCHVQASAGDSACVRGE
jgi:hypothetical protein